MISLSTRLRRLGSSLGKIGLGACMVLALEGCQGGLVMAPGSYVPVAHDDQALFAWHWPYEMGPLNWGRVRRARSAVESGDYADGLERLERMAEEGLPPAYYELAKMYHYGHGVSRNLRRAEAFYRQAIRVNSSIRDNASYNLARLYLSHPELGEHDLLAYHLLRQALQGERSAEALTWLASLLARGGEGVTADPERALGLYHEAIALGSADALLALAEGYYIGGFLPRDESASQRYLERYLELLRERSADDDTEAMLELARLYGPQGMLGPNPQKRLAWLLRAAEGGNADAMRRAGEMMLLQTPSRGFALLQRAAHRGSVPAMAEVGALCLGERGLAADPVQARFWLERAVSQHSQPAAITLGEALLVGNVLDAQPAKGRALLEQAGRQGEGRALAILGRAFRDGHSGVPRRPRMALDYFERGHRLGDLGATVALGKAYLEGLNDPVGDVSARPEKGEVLLETAVARGDAGAMRVLAEAYLQDGPLAYRPDRARSLLQRAVVLGDAAAMTRLADAYLSGALGDGTAKPAIDLLEAAAEQGNGYAMVLLGRAYRQAPADMTPDLEISERWLRRAVEAGHPSALRALYNTLYAKGLKGDVAALEEVARGGHAGAMEALGERYLEGTGVALEPERAERWLVEAARAGRDGAALRLGRAYLRGEGLARDVTKALRYLGSLAERGNDAAALALGRAYLHGEGVAQDVDAGRRYLAPLADAGEATAAMELGRAYLMGPESFRRPNRARCYLEQAAAAGDLSAQGTLGKALLRGDMGLAQDVERGQRLLTEAAESEHAGSLMVLGREYLSAEILPYRPERGARYLLRAARMGHDDARFELVKAYLRANGLAPHRANRRQALLWLNGLIRHNDALALETLYEVLAEMPPPEAASVDG